MPDSVTFDDMETYLVGGAVRDKLLGLPVIDRDWVVVGETPQNMIKAGFKSVGKDFPVFLHPETHEEYALARTERKTGPGYHGFEFDTSASVTIEEDLSRRDLTINAIAQDDQGKLIDPFNGQQDIQKKRLRHVSAAFAEDPVRILRIAKFMARFSHLGFEVENETIDLIRSMVISGEVDNLVAERVWKELEASLDAQNPAAFFTCLKECNALSRVIPELTQLNADVAQSACLEQLNKSTAISDDSSVRFAALCNTFGPERIDELQNMCSRLRAPRAHTELALLCAKHSHQLPSVSSYDANQIHSLLKALDISRRAERFTLFLQASRVSLPEFNGDKNKNEAPITHLLNCAHAMTTVDTGSIAKKQTDKARIPVAIKESEVDAIKEFLAG